jgi:DNA-binding LacI/PurR family transcriptional regulator
LPASNRGPNGSRPTEANEAAEPNGQSERRPSIADVATVARVSHQTVSRVLNDNPSVGELTRARVLAAIDQLGYRPNIAARALASGRSKTLGVVAMDTSLYGPVSTLNGFQLAAQQHGYFVSVVAVHAIDRQSVRDAVHWLTSQSVEGLAVIAPLTSAHDALATLPTGTPVVAVEGDPEADMSVVTVDQAGDRAPPGRRLRNRFPCRRAAGVVGGARAHGRLEGCPPGCRR